MKQQDRWWDLGNVYRYRDENLRALGFESYKMYLASALWKGIRARVLEQHPNCLRCGKKATQVHHRAYDPATLRGELLAAMNPACAKCHRRAEKPDLRRPSVDRINGANGYFLKGRVELENRKARKRERNRRKQVKRLARLLEHDITDEQACEVLNAQ